MKRTVLAALDGSPAARPVLDAALGIGELMGADVEAVHVAEDRAETPEWLAAQKGVELRMLDGPVEPRLIDALADEAVIAAAFGARSTAGGRRPVGRTAMQVLRQASKPIVVVPPDATGVVARPIHRLLVPLEGTVPSSQPVLEGLCPLVVGDAELIVLHVFTSETVPRVLDRSARDLSLWGDEFVARFCPGAVRIELRTGLVGARVAEVTVEESVDLVVLSWSRDDSAGHAAVIHDVLGRSSVPVLLLPVEPLSERQR